MVGYALFLGAGSNANIGYAASFIACARLTPLRLRAHVPRSILGSFPGGVFCSSWAAANQGTDSARATAIGIVVLAGNCGCVDR
jgi:hypothetical protein